MQSALNLVIGPTTKLWARLAAKLGVGLSRFRYEMGRKGKQPKKSSSLNAKKKHIAISKSSLPFVLLPLSLKPQASVPPDGRKTGLAKPWPTADGV
jgi:hypothetical protein